MGASLSTQPGKHVVITCYTPGSTSLRFPNIHPL